MAPLPKLARPCALVHADGGVEVAAPRAIRRAAARREAQFFQQHGQRDGEGVVDAQVVDLVRADAGVGIGLPERARRAGVEDIAQRRQVLVAMRLPGAADAHGPVVRADHQRHRAVGDRAAVQQVQRRGDGPGRQHLVHADGFAQVRMRVAGGVAPHQRGELGQVFAAGAGLVHVG